MEATPADGGMGEAGDAAHRSRCARRLTPQHDPVTVTP